MPRTGRVIWTLLFGKGGAGKTSTVVALAGVAFAHGSIFVVIHTDPQADALRWLGSDWWCTNLTLTVSPRATALYEVRYCEVGRPSRRMTWASAAARRIGATRVYSGSFQKP